MKNRTDSVCVIGAGPSGITAAKNILDKGFSNLTIYDRGSEVGGNWVFEAESGHSSVFETTHLISSKNFSQYDDYPIPQEYPDYPGHQHLADYFQGYAKNFNLYDCIEFNTMVEHCKKTSDGKWAITTSSNGQTKTVTFDWLVVCNGHHWKPRYPKWADKNDPRNNFTGIISHSHDFKRAEPYKNKRILVIGGGNSACDIAVETARISHHSDISMRRGYWIVPKFIFGQPADYLHNKLDNMIGWIPWKYRRSLLEGFIKLYNGKNWRYGMQEPDHRFGGTHPTSNSELMYFIRHGEIDVKHDVAKLDGNTVTFTDGSSAEYDEIICCTGFEICHPFFDSNFIDYSEGAVPLYLKMLPEKHDNLAFIGLFQPLGCIWPAAELQSKIFARKMTGEWKAPEDMKAAIQYEIDNPDIKQLNTARHTITVDYPKFRKRLLKELPKDYISTDPVDVPKATEAELKKAS